LQARLAFANDKGGYVPFGVTDPDKADDKPSAIAFEVGGEYAIKDNLNAYLNVGSDNVDYFKGNGLYVKLGGTLSLGGNGEIGIFDKVSGWFAEDHKVGAKDVSSTTNQLQVELVWKF
jgi:hypothetical protein